MSKRTRELQQLIAQKSAQAQAFTEGEGKDITKAKELLDECKGYQQELDVLTQLEEVQKGTVPTDPVPVAEKKADGFNMIAKLMHKKSLNDVEKAALVSGTNSANGETYLVPEDVKAEINELRKSYVSAKHLVTVETTDALAGSVTYESGTPAGLADFDDGDAITEETGVKFVLKKFAIASEIDLRGMDSIEAICVLDRYLDEAMRSNLPSVRIIHGKGTGALRAAVQQSLRKNRFVRKFRLGAYGEGEDGVTIAEF